MTHTAKTNPLVELAITLIIPALVLMKLSGPENLGAVNALLLYTPALMNVECIQENLDARDNRGAFDVRLKAATWMLAGAFFFSSSMNYLLATWIVTSPAGTPAFNEELGRLTLLSYPMIALPSTLIMMAALYYLARSIRQLAGLTLGESIKH